MHAKNQRIVRTRAGLLVVDIQEKLLPAIFDQDIVLQNALTLIQGAAILKVPVFVTEQYRKGLGPTVPAIAQALAGVEPREKLAFSACGAPGLVEGLRQAGLDQVILCGIEAHVCVCQTCLDLLGEGLTACVVADAVSSRTPQNRQVALDRLRAAGALIVSTEMILFELLEKAGTAEFRQLLPLIK